MQTVLLDMTKELAVVALRGVAWRCAAGGRNATLWVAPVANR